MMEGLQLKSIDMKLLNVEEDSLTSFLPQLSSSSNVAISPYSTFKVHVVTVSSTSEVERSINDLIDLQEFLREENILGVSSLNQNVPNYSTASGRFFESEAGGKKLIVKLENYLKHLLERPDIRNSKAMLQFLGIYGVSAPSSLPLQPQKSMETHRSLFAVTELLYDVRTGNVISVHQDMTDLSVLGKMWILVELEQVGAISVWNRVTMQPEDEALIEPIYSVKLFYRAQCAALFAAEDILLIGGHDGSVHIYYLPASGDNMLSEVKVIRHLHSNTILGFSCGGLKVLSYGGDKSIRVLDVSTQAIDSGGNLSKRLQPGEALTACYFDAEKQVAVLGTSNANLLLLSVEKHPPSFLTSSRVCEAGEISCITLYGRNLFVGVNSTVYCLFFKESLKDEKLDILAIFESEFSDFRAIRSIFLQNKMLLVCYEVAMAVWCASTGKCLAALSVEENLLSKIIAVPPTTTGKTQSFTFAAGSISYGNFQVMHWDTSPLTFWTPNIHAAPLKEQEDLKPQKRSFLYPNTHKRGEEAANKPLQPEEHTDSFEHTRESRLSGYEEDTFVTAKSAGLKGSSFPYLRGIEAIREGGLIGDSPPPLIAPSGKSFRDDNVEDLHCREHAYIDTHTTMHRSLLRDEEASAVKARHSAGNNRKRDIEEDDFFKNIGKALA